VVGISILAFLGRDKGELFFNSSDTHPLISTFSMQYRLARGQIEAKPNTNPPTSWLLTVKERARERVSRLSPKCFIDFKSIGYPFLRH
jgi:hypothetical protein